MQFAGGIARASPAAPLLLQSDYWLVFSDRLEMIAKSKVMCLGQRQHRSSLCCRDTVWGHNMHCSSAQTCHSGISAPVRCFKLSRRRKKDARLLSASCSSSERKPIYTASFSSVSNENRGESVEEESECLTLDEIKSTLCLALEGINRGIFGVPSAKKLEIEGLVNLLESRNPTLNPTQNLEKVAGCWKLIYSTITILGSKRTKLGLRDFIALGDFLQIIDIAKGKAANVIKFNVRGLNILNGQLLIEASFKIASNTRVDISYSDSSITPQQLMNLFRLNYKLLLGIFNPEGWLEITYVDDTLRIGRDDKGNIFILERSEDW